MPPGAAIDVTGTPTSSNRIAGQLDLNHWGGAPGGAPPWLDLFL